VQFIGDYTLLECSKIMEDVRFYDRASGSNGTLVCYSNAA